MSDKIKLRIMLILVILMVILSYTTGGPESAVKTIAFVGFGAWVGKYWHMLK